MYLALKECYRYFYERAGDWEENIFSMLQDVLAKAEGGKQMDEQKINEQKKICPMLSRAIEGGTWFCEEDNCAWWSAKYIMCVVKDIAGSLDDLVYDSPRRL
jgi:hypothetical protein